MIDVLLSYLKTAAMATLWPVYSLLFEGGSRYYWVYCVTGIVMMFYAHHVNAGRAPGERSLFDREVWMGKSAQNDYFIIIFGSVLRLTFFSWTILNWKAIAAFVASVLHAAGVEGTVNDSAAFAAAIALTLTLFVADDFTKWFVHYVMHKIPELWEFHKVHHSAEELNFITAERHHPLEVTLTATATTIVFGSVNGIFIACFGDTLTVQTVFGANMFLVAFNLFGGVLRHSPVWISFGPRIERWIISPAMHQIHHSGDVRHFDKNMGGALAIWDRMFGTLYIPNGREITSFGIGEETQDFRSLSVIYVRPFVRAWTLIKSRFVQPADTPAQA
jgi:sterol desaturase/sphingolipid hydroxylase (fatty acid hydroxylase superfamily)